MFSVYVFGRERERERESNCEEGAEAERTQRHFSGHPYLVVSSLKYLVLPINQEWRRRTLLGRTYYEIVRGNLEFFE